jgi:hypothetical protein
MNYYSVITPDNYVSFHGTCASVDDLTVKLENGQQLIECTKDEYDIIHYPPADKKIFRDNGIFKPVGYLHVINVIEEWQETVQLINNGIVPVADLKKQKLQDLFSEAKLAIESDTIVYKTGSSILQADYAMYRIGDDRYLAAGLTWKYAGETYGAKYQDGIITDVYIIYKDGEYFSSQIDPATGEIIANYSKSGDNKLDPRTGEIIQPSTKVTTLYDIPLTAVKAMVDKGFPYIYDVFYYSEKPYGNTVEFSVAGL